MHRHLLLVVLSFFLMGSALAARPQITCVTSGCHSEISHNLFKHGPITGKGCAICHVPGDSEGLKLPKEHPSIKPIVKKDINGACLVCHDELGDRLSKQKYTHKVIAEKSCTTCHNPHGSNNKFFLREKTTPTLCLTCHEKIKTEVTNATVHHSAVTDGESCLACHDPHGSAQNKLLKKGESELCLKCHSKEVKTKSGETLVNIQKLLETNPVHHKPIQEGTCTGCHKPHGSQERRLLKKGYDNSFYQDFSEEHFGLCFECHKNKLATQPEVTDETRFRNGPMNLHFFHLQGGTKGRGCAACHSVHATKQPKLIADWVNFLGMQIPIRFQKAENGGTCATACHGPKTYDRVKGFKNAPGR